MQYSIYAFRRCVAWQLLDCLTSFNLQTASVSVFLNKDMLMCHRQYLCWSRFQVKAHPHKLVLYFIGTFIFQVAIDLQYLTNILKEVIFLKLKFPLVNILTSRSMYNTNISVRCLHYLYYYCTVHLHYIVLYYIPDIKWFK